MNDKMTDPDIDDTTCGMWLFKPRWLQIFASKKVYVLAYGLLGLNQFMLSSYFNGTLTTMEKRFKFSSQMSGKYNFYYKFNTINVISIYESYNLYF